MNKMPLHVPESLFEYRLNEAVSHVEKILQEMDPSIGPENPKYQILVDKFKDIPTEYLDKFIEWVYPMPKKHLDDVASSLLDAYENAENKDIENNPNSFQSLDNYLDFIEKEVEKNQDLVRTDLTPGEVIGNVDTKIRTEKKDKTSSFDGRDSHGSVREKKIEEFFTDPDKVIEKLGLIESGKRGIYYSKGAYSYPDKGKPGQGLYVWTDLSQLWESYVDGIPIEDLSIFFKFGQFGALAGKKKNKETLEDAVEDDKDMKMSGKLAKETIAEYSGTFMGHKVILFIINLDSEIKEGKFNNALEAEKGIQKELKSKHWSNPVNLKSTEVFRKKGGTFKDLEEIIRKFVTGSPKVPFKPREEQDSAIDKAFKYFSSNPDHDEFLLAAKMRFGKNLTVLDIIKKLNDQYPNGPYKDNLVISYKPSVFSSLKDDISKFSDFDNFEIIEINKQKNIPKNSDKIRIFISSSQFALYKANFDDQDEFANGKNNLNKLAEESLDSEIKKLQDQAYKNYKTHLGKIDKNSGINFGIIMADEYHYGTKSRNFITILDNINYEKIIWVSGTAMKDMVTGKFSEDQIYNWSYLDEQKRKKQEKEAFEKNPDGNYPHLDLPTMNIFRPKISDSIKNSPEFLRLYSDEEAFTFRKMIEVVDENVSDKDKKLKNAALMESFLEQIMTSKHGPEMSIMEVSNADPISLRHSFWVFPKYTNGIIAVANLMRSMSIFNDYEIIEATGQYNNNIDRVKNIIADAENAGRKSITLTCYRFKEGTTVPEWGAAIMVDDGESAEEYLQAIFRCQSPGRKGKNGKILKENCYVFDFQPARVTKIIHDMAYWESDDPAGGQESDVMELLRFLPVWQKNENNKIEKIDADELIREYQLSASFSESFANDRVFNFRNIEKLKDPYFSKVLSKISSKKKETKQNLSDNDMTKGKNFETTGVGDEDSEDDIPGDEEPKTDLDILKDKARNVLRTIPTFLFVSDKAEKSIRDIIETNDRTLFRSVTGVDPEFLERLLEEEIINEREIKDLIEFFRGVIIEFEKNPSMESAQSFIENHMVIRGESGSTPNSIVNEMLDKLPEDIWKDSNKTFCDPVCGSGKFLLGIKDRLMQNLPNKISGKYQNEVEKEKYIIENMIFGADKEIFKIKMTKKLLGDRPYKYRIMEKDSSDQETWINEKGEKMKFDVVVGNPPYKGDLHLDFLQLAHNISKRFILWIQPSNWLLDEKGLTKKYSGTRELIKNDIVEIKLFNGNPTFNTELYSPFMISLIDKNKGGGPIKVENVVTKNIEIYDNIHSINKWNNSEEYPSLKEKIKSLSEKSNLNNFLNKKTGNFFVSTSKVLGNTIRRAQYKKDPKKYYDIMYKDDFHTLISKYNKVEEGSPSGQMWWSFKTRDEAQNFLDFIKTRWGMFALSIFKSDQNLFSGRPIKIIPWLDWSRPWTEKDFEELIGATPEEKEFVYKNIPDYYGIAKKTK